MPRAVLGGKEESSREEDILKKSPMTRGTVLVRNVVLTTGEARVAEGVTLSENLRIH